MTDLDLAYLAGVIDCDGYVTIWSSLKSNAGRAKPNTYYAVKVGIAGTRRQPHDLAASLFGGNVSCYVPKNGQHRPQFQWSATGPTATAFLGGVRPYLRVKDKQADLALQFQLVLEEHIREQRETQKPPYRVTEAMQVKRNELWQAMRVLNGTEGRVSRIGKRAAGRLLDGREWNEVPE